MSGNGQLPSTIYWPTYAGAPAAPPSNGVKIVDNRVWFLSVHVEVPRSASEALARRFERVQKRLNRIAVKNNTDLRRLLDQLETLADNLSV